MALAPLSVHVCHYYPDYMNDPYSEKDPMNAICSRGDLQETPRADGCYDTKVSLSLSYIPSHMCTV